MSKPIPKQPLLSKKSPAGTTVPQLKDSLDDRFYNSCIRRSVAMGIRMVMAATAAMGIATAHADTVDWHSHSNAAILPVSYQPDSYCTAQIEANTSHPQRQSQLRHDIDCMMTELKAYQADNQPAMIRYHAYKAQGWLNYAYHEDAEGSLTRAGEYALAEGLSILTGLRNNQSSRLSSHTPIPPTSGLMRPDLWATLMGIKANGAMTATPRETAYAEVKLVWAAAEYCEFGWRHAREHFAAAERWVNQAKVTAYNTAPLQAATDRQTQLDGNIYQYQQQIVPLVSDGSRASCQGQALPVFAKPSVAIVMPTASVTYSIAQPQPQAYHPYLVHFSLDSSALSAASKQVLDDLVASVAHNPQRQQLQLDLYGHTDTRASVAYNLALSQRRINSVVDYLVSQGIAKTQMQAHPEGKQNLKQTGSSLTDHALNRRVEIYLSLDGDHISSDTTDHNVMQQRDYSDLQLEH